MGVQVSNDISSERTYRICSPEFMYTPGEGLQEVVKHVKRIVKFEILNFWQMGVNISKLYSYSFEYFQQNVS